MCKVARNFFTAEEQQRIRDAVQQAESRTSGEIVPMVVDQSYHYPRAEILGAGFFSLATALLLAWWLGDSSIWVFLPLFLAGYFPYRWLINALPGLKRRMIHPQEITEEVAEKAMVSFVEQGLHYTRDATGILLLVSLFERRVQVLADRGINAKVDPAVWQEIVDTVVDGLRSGKACDALCAAIGRCGDLLEQKCPRREDDTDELPNPILGSARAETPNGP